MAQELFDGSIASEMTLGEALRRAPERANRLAVVNNFEGLCSIAGLEQEMVTAVQRMYREGEDDKIATNRFQIIEQVQGCRLLFERRRRYALEKPGKSNVRQTPERVRMLGRLGIG